MRTTPVLTGQSSNTPATQPRPATQPVQVRSSSAPLQPIAKHDQTPRRNPQADSHADHHEIIHCNHPTLRQPPTHATSATPRMVTFVTSIRCQNQATSHQDFVWIQVQRRTLFIIHRMAVSPEKSGLPHDLRVRSIGLDRFPGLRLKINTPERRDPKD